MGSVQNHQCKVIVNLQAGPASNDRPTRINSEAQTKIKATARREKYIERNKKKKKMINKIVSVDKAKIRTLDGTDPAKKSQNGLVGCGQKTSAQQCAAIEDKASSIAGQAYQAREINRKRDKSKNGSEPNRKENKCQQRILEPVAARGIDIRTRYERIDIV